MAEVSNSESGNRRSLKRPLKRPGNIKVDMTPMVDLGFLLITFFMLTMVLSEPRAMSYAAPKSDGTPPMTISECRTINVIIDSSDRVFVYNGLDMDKMEVTGFDAGKGVRQSLLKRIKHIKANCPVKKSGEQESTICLIKFLPGASYNSMVNILDEMLITGTETYAIQEVTNDEVVAVQQQMELLANN